MKITPVNLYKHDKSDELYETPNEAIEGWRRWYRERMIEVIEPDNHHMDSIGVLRNKATDEVYDILIDPIMDVNK